MTDADFEGKLADLFQAPSGQADTARLKSNVLHTVRREDRLRSLVVVGSGLGGAGITALIITKSGFIASARTILDVLWARLPAPVTPDLDIDLNAPWAIALLGLLLAGLAASRAARDF